MSPPAPPVLQPSGIAVRALPKPTTAEDHRNPAGAPTDAAMTGRGVRHEADAFQEELALEKRQDQLYVQRVRLQQQLRELEAEEAAQVEEARAVKRRRLENAKAHGQDLDGALREKKIYMGDEGAHARDHAGERLAQRILAIKLELDETLTALPPLGDLHDDEMDLDDGDHAAMSSTARAPTSEPGTSQERTVSRAGRGDTTVHWQDTHLQRLTPEQKAVPYELYRHEDANADKELQYLARVVNHQPAQRVVRPTPEVPKLKQVLLHFGIPVKALREAPRPAEPAFRNRIAGTTMGERFLVTSPNASYLPYIHEPDRNMRLRMRADGRFGAEDMTLVPTYYLAARAPHLACIPREPPCPLHPHRIMWMAPDPLLEAVVNGLATPADLAATSELVVLKAPVAEQLRRLIVPLRKRVGQYIDKCREEGESPIAWARGLEVALGHTYGRLKAIPTLRKRAFLMVREVQRLWLELKGLMTFVMEVRPILSGQVEPPEVYTVRWVLGAATTDPEVVQHLHRAGIPVWYVQKLSADLLARMSSTDKRGATYAHYTCKMRTPEQMEETGRHPDNLPYIFEGPPTDFLRLRQMHRYATLSIANDSGYSDDMLVPSGRDPYHMLGYGRIYGSSSKERPLEYLSARPAEAGPSKVGETVEHVMPVVELNVSDAVAAEDPPQPEAFVVDDPSTWPQALPPVEPAELTVDECGAPAEAPPSPTILETPQPPPGAASWTATTPASSRVTSAPSTANDDSGKGFAKSAVPLWTPIGVHDRPRARHHSRTWRYHCIAAGTYTTTGDHKLDLPQMLPSWTMKASAVRDSWPSDAGAGDQFRNFPLPSTLVGPQSDEKVARFIQVWLLLSDAAIANARRNARDRDAFQRHGTGLTWAQPEGQPPVERREDFVEVPAADRTPLIQEEPCLAVSAQVWKDILNAHTSFHSKGNLRGALMDQVRALLRQTTDFEKIRSDLTRRYSIFGDGWVDPGQLPPTPVIKDVLWRLNELVFRKDLIDLDRRARLCVLTPAEEHLRLQNPFDPSTFGADILSVHGRGRENKGLVADDWKERYRYVVGMADLMRDWHDGLPAKVLRVLEQRTMSQGRFEWLEGQVAEHYALQLWRLFHRKVVGPARRSTAP